MQQVAMQQQQQRSSRGSSSSGDARITGFAVDPLILSLLVDAVVARDVRWDKSSTASIFSEDMGMLLVLLMNGKFPEINRMNLKLFVIRCVLNTHRS